LLLRVADELGGKCNYVIVRNAPHSDSFELYEGSRCAQIANKFGGKEINMTQLPDWLVIALNQRNLTITAAAKHQDFSLIDRPRLQTWQRRSDLTQLAAGSHRLDVANADESVGLRSRHKLDEGFQFKRDQPDEPSDQFHQLQHFLWLIYP